MVTSVAQSGLTEEPAHWQRSASEGDWFLDSFAMSELPVVTSHDRFEGTHWRCAQLFFAWSPASVTSGCICVHAHLFGCPRSLCGPEPDMLLRAVAAALINAQLQLRSFEEIQLHEAAEFAKLLEMHYFSFSKRERHQEMARELAAASNHGICDLLEFIHKAARKLLECSPRA